MTFWSIPSSFPQFLCISCCYLNNLSLFLVISYIIYFYCEFLVISLLLLAYSLYLSSPGWRHAFVDEECDLLSYFALVYGRFVLVWLILIRYQSFHTIRSLFIIFIIFVLAWLTARFRRWEVRLVVAASLSGQPSVHQHSLP